MPTFDEALAELDGKIDLIIEKFASDDAAVRAAQQEAADAKAAADAVIADDAAGDEAQDAARAEALAAVSGKIDAVLNPAPPVEEPPVDEPPVEPVV